MTAYGRGTLLTTASHRVAAGLVLAAHAAQQEARAKNARRAAGLLRALREEKGLTLRALAKDLGISAAYLCDAERGRRNPLPILKRFIHGGRADG